MPAVRYTPISPFRIGYGNQSPLPVSSCNSHHTHKKGPRWNHRKCLLGKDFSRIVLCHFYILVPQTAPKCRPLSQVTQSCLQQALKGWIGCEVHSLAFCEYFSPCFWTVSPSQQLVAIASCPSAVHLKKSVRVFSVSSVSVGVLLTIRSLNLFSVSLVFPVALCAPAHNHVVFVVAMVMRRRLD